MKVGVLALQGAIEPHLKMLERVGATPIRVVDPAGLDSVDRLILPGGESSTMLKLLNRTGLWEPLRDFGQSHPVWGVCAGAILIATKVINPEQASLGLINITAQRNYYGSQADSFKAEVKIPVLGVTVSADFIRAPLLQSNGNFVKIMAEHGNQPVLLQEGRVLASAFHVELGASVVLHEYFLSI